MKNFPVRKTVIAGALGALSIVLAITPLGFIPWFAGMSLTVMHIPVIVAAVLEGPLVGTIVGFIFGVASLLKAAVAPNGPGDVIFTNPFISVLPRLFIGVAVWAVFSLFRGKARPVAAFIAGAAGSLTNTILVLTAIVVAKILTLEVAISILVSNGLLEAAAAAVITLAIVVAWKGIESAGGKARLSKEG